MAKAISDKAFSGFKYRVEFHPRFFAAITHNKFGSIFVCPNEAPIGQSPCQTVASFSRFAPNKAFLQDLLFFGLESGLGNLFLYFVLAILSCADKVILSHLNGLKKAVQCNFVFVPLMIANPSQLRIKLVRTSESEPNSILAFKSLNQNGIAAVRGVPITVISGRNYDCVLFRGFHFSVFL